MHKQMIITIKNLAKINKLLSEGWSFNHTVGEKNAYALLSKYENTRQELGLAMARVPNTEQPAIRYIDPQEGGF